MRRTLTTAATVVACILGFWLLWTQPGAWGWDEVEKKVKAVHSVQFSVTMEPAPSDPQVAPGPNGVKAVVRWSRPGRARIDTYTQDGDLESTDILVSDKPGIRLLHTSRRYDKLPPARVESPWNLLGPYLHDPVKVAAKGRDLGEKMIDGQKARGFEALIHKLGGDLPADSGDTLRLWVHPDTKLPIRFEVILESKRKVRMVGKDFVWDRPIDEAMFAQSPPEGYQAAVVEAADKDEKEVVDAFKTYAEVMGGSYPKATAIFGDILRDEMLRKLGFARPFKLEDTQKEVFQKVIKATNGFALLSQSQRFKTDFRYHGQTVTPKEAEKVLLRWRTDEGRYRVLHGDLHFATVDATALKKLESR